MTKTVWNRFFFGLAVITSLALLIWIAGSSAAAQNTMTGTWTASISNKENSKLNLNLERRNENKGSRHQSGQSYEFSELQGLSREQVVNGGAVSFSLVREAGRVDFEGSFQNGKGSGTFRFTPNAAFVSAMKSRGFDFQPDSDGEERLLTATTLNITTALADDLTSAGLGKIDIHDLFKAAIFKIDSQFVRDMKASGFNDLGLEELVKARIFKIDANFVREISQMGFDKEPFESLVKMQIFKITPQFISEVRNEGLTDLKIEQLVKLRIFKIDGEFIRNAKAEGASIDVESLVQRRLGVARRVK